MDPFSYGCPSLIRPWDDDSRSIENAKRRVDVAFEVMWLESVGTDEQSGSGFACTYEGGCVCVCVGV